MVQERRKREDRGHPQRSDRLCMQVGLAGAAGHDRASDALQRPVQDRAAHDPLVRDGLVDDVVRADPAGCERARLRHGDRLEVGTREREIQRARRDVHSVDLVATNRETPAERVVGVTAAISAPFVTIGSRANDSAVIEPSAAPHSRAYAGTSAARLRGVDGPLQVTEARS
jgi:hypothetical protein